LLTFSHINLSPYNPSYLSPTVPEHTLIQANFSDTFKKPYKCVCTSAAVVSPDLLSPTPSLSSAMKTPENTEEDLTTLNQQMKDIPNGILL
jgi:hypothetical protein